MPRLSRILGESQPVQGFGESRLAVMFHRMVFPDGSSVSLDKANGLNTSGDNGLKGKVNNRFLSTFLMAGGVGSDPGIESAGDLRRLPG